MEGENRFPHFDELHDERAVREREELGVLLGVSGPSRTGRFYCLRETPRTHHFVCPFPVVILSEISEMCSVEWEW